ncbi:UNVERIFIED_CONTAM: hypothetical protein FKN15_001218 [Acipenser sinensis]
MTRVPSVLKARRMVDTLVEGGLIVVGFGGEVWEESSEQLHLGKCILNKNLVLLGIRQEKIDKERWLLIWSAILCVRETLWKARNMLICKGVVIGSREVVQLAEYYLCDYRRRRHSEDSTPRGTKRKMCS